MRGGFIAEVILSGTVLSVIFFICQFLFLKLADRWIGNRPPPSPTNGKPPRGEETDKIETPTKRAGGPTRALDLLEERERFRQQLLYPRQLPPEAIERSLEEEFTVIYLREEAESEEESGSGNDGPTPEELEGYALELPELIDRDEDEEATQNDDALSGIDPWGADPTLCLTHIVRGNPPGEEKRVEQSYRIVHDTELMRQFEQTGYFSEVARQRLERLRQRVERLNN